MKISKIAAGRFSHDCSILQTNNSSPNFQKILNADKTSSQLRTLKRVDSGNIFLNFLTKWAPCVLCHLAKNQSNSLTGCAASVSRYAESLLDMLLIIRYPGTQLLMFVSFKRPVWELWKCILKFRVPYVLSIELAAINSPLLSVFLSSFHLFFPTEELNISDDVLILICSNSTHSLVSPSHWH